MLEETSEDIQMRTLQHKSFEGCRSGKSVRPTLGPARLETSNQTNTASVLRAVLGLLLLLVAWFLNVPSTSQCTSGDGSTETAGRIATVRNQT